MNYIYILWHEIKKLVKHNKITFVIVSVSMIVSTFGILFYAGYIAWGYESSSQQTELEIELKHNISSGKIKKLYEELKVADISHVVVATDKESYEDDSRLCIVGEYDIAYEYLREAGHYFKLDSNEDGIVVCEDSLDEKILANGNPVYQKLTIENQEYAIKGIVLFMDHLNYATSVNHYLNTGQVGYIKITYGKGFSANKASVLHTLKNFGDIETYSMIDPIPIVLQSDMWMNFGSILLIFCIVIINLFMIIAYWIRQQKKDYNIYMLCGAGKNTVHWLCLFKMFSILALNMFIGTGIFLIAKNEMSKQGLSLDQTAFYLEILAVVMVIIFVFSYITLKKSNHKNFIYYVKD